MANHILSQTTMTKRTRIPPTTERTLILRAIVQTQSLPPTAQRTRVPPATAQLTEVPLTTHHTVVLPKPRRKIRPMELLPTEAHLTEVLPTARHMKGLPNFQLMELLSTVARLTDVPLHTVLQPDPAHTAHRPDLLQAIATLAKELLQATPILLHRAIDPRTTEAIIDTIDCLKILLSYFGSSAILNPQ